MKWWSVAVALLWLLACRDPNSYQPFDPTKPDPPGPPVLVQPVNGWKCGDYTYPQVVNFGWQGVTGARFYEIQFSVDSLFRSTYLGQHVYQTSVAESMPDYGLYYWRVRAASSNWNNYTDWSSYFQFELANLPQVAQRSGPARLRDKGLGRSCRESGTGTLFRGASGHLGRFRPPI